MPERGVRPQHALRRDALARLAHVHRDGGAEEVLDLVAVGVRGDPAGAADGHAAEDEGGEVEEGDAVEVGGEEADHVLLEADEDDAGDGALELGDGGHGLVDASVCVGVRIPVVVACVRVRRGIIAIM